MARPKNINTNAVGPIKTVSCQPVYNGYSLPIPIASFLDSEDWWLKMQNPVLE